MTRFENADFIEGQGSFLMKADVKALGIMLLRMKLGMPAGVKSDEEVRDAFSSWKGAVNEQEYNFIDFIGECLTGKTR